MDRFWQKLEWRSSGGLRKSQNGEFDVFQSLCPSNETRWRRTTFTTHGTVMQSTPNEDHYGPLQFQTIFLVHCRKIPKFHRTSQGHFSLTDGSADWQVYLNYSMEDSNASKKKATSPAATARNFRRSADFDGGFPKNNVGNNTNMHHVMPPSYI